LQKRRWLLLTRERLRYILEWADRELEPVSPLNLEGLELKANIKQHLKAKWPLDAIEPDVDSLDQVLQTLRSERWLLESRKTLGWLLIGIPDFSAHMQFLENADMPEQMRSMMKDQFSRGENYVI
jgi:hypothetical protein